MIESFYALRFINALMIFTHHKNIINNSYLVALGPCSVSFFIMLSGFVMSLGYYKKCALPDFCYEKYIYKRVLRLWPLHLICLIGAICLNIKIIFGGGYRFIVILLNALMLQSFIPDQSVYFSLNAVSWTLCDLMFCYSVFPFVVKLFNDKRTALILLSYYFITVFFVTLLVPSSEVHAIVYINPVMRFCDFLLGVILYKVYMLKLITIKKTGTAIVLQIISIVLVLICLYLYPRIPERIGLVSLFYIPSAFVILVFALTDKKGIGRLFDNKLFKILGNISFEIYMTHVLCISVIEFFLKLLSLQIDYFIPYLSELIITVFVGFILNSVITNFINPRKNN